MSRTHRAAAHRRRALRSRECRRGRRRDDVRTLSRRTGARSLEARCRRDRDARSCHVRGRRRGRRGAHCARNQRAQEVVMIAVSPVSGADPRIHEVSAQPPPSSGEGSLLPSPDATALVGRDPLSMLYLFEQKEQRLGLDEGTKRIEGVQSERNRSIDQELQAIAKQAEAAKHKSLWDDLGGVLGEVAKVAGLVASAAAVVCTAGAATPLLVLAVVGAAESAASVADGEVRGLVEKGVGAQTAGWLCVGVSL